MWDISLVKEGSEENLLADMKADNCTGILAEAGNVSILEMDPDTLTPEAARAVLFLDALCYEKMKKGLAGLQ